MLHRAADCPLRWRVESRGISYGATAGWLVGYVHKEIRMYGRSMRTVPDVLPIATSGSRLAKSVVHWCIHSIHFMQLSAPAHPHSSCSAVVLP